MSKDEDLIDKRRNYPYKILKEKEIKRKRIFKENVKFISQFYRDDVKELFSSLSRVQFQRYYISVYRKCILNQEEIVLFLELLKQKNIFVTKEELTGDIDIKDKILN